MKHKSTVNGFIRAVADQTHPLQTKLSLILTDFEPNGNKQGIPRDEKDNIIRTAQYMPLKINFNGTTFTGHSGAFPIGPIVAAYESTDSGRDVIMGDAVIWDEVYSDISEHLKVAFSEGIGTSWEVYFEDSVKDDNGIEWLTGCVFAGTCVVEVPAYGPNRTRVLAIAEKLAEMEINMAKEQNTATAETDMVETREELIQVQDILFKLWEGVDTLFNTTFEIEAAQVENDIGKIAVQFAEKLSKLADRINELRAASSELTSVSAELETLKREKQESELLRARAERKARLIDAGIEMTDEKLEQYMSMSDEVFTTLVSDVSTINKKSKTTAEQNVVLPEPLGKQEIDATAIIEALRKEFNTRA